MSRERVLLAEDDPIDRKITARLLSELGFDQILQATNGQEALEMARQTKPDLILMDIEMPGAMDGIQAAIAVRSELGIPSIFVTAAADLTFVDRACFAKPIGYLVKPVNKLSLYGGIQVGLEQNRLVSELKAALNQVKMLSGLLPICAHCKKIRNNDNVWEQLEEYIDKHSEASFSHSICPECIKTHFPEFAKDI